MPVSAAVADDRLADLSRARLDAIETRIEELARRCETREDASAARLLIRIAQLLSAQGRDLIERELRHAGERGDDAEARRSRIQACLNAVDNVCSDALEALVYPPERDIAALIQPFTRLARALTNQNDTELVFETVEAYGYEVWANVWESAEENVRSISPRMNSVVMALPRLAIVYTPGRADADTFLHAVIAHEIAHLALFKGPLAGQVFEEVLVRHLARETIEKEDVEQLKCWFEELLCDVIASRMIGPIYFLALLEFLVPAHRPNQAFGTHPPVARRLQRLVPEVERFFADARSVPEIATAHSAVQEAIGLMPTPEDPSDPKLRESSQRHWAFLEDALGEIDERVDDLVGRARYWEDTFRSDLPLVWDKIEQGVAPAELVHGRGIDDSAEAQVQAAREAGDPRLGLAPPPSTPWSRPIEWRSILNGCFLDWLHRSNPERIGTADERADTRQKAARLARGSIELSELHREMIGLREQLDVLNDRRPQPAPEVAP